MSASSSHKHHQQRLALHSPVSPPEQLAERIRQGVEIVEVVQAQGRAIAHHFLPPREALVQQALEIFGAVEAQRRDSKEVLGHIQKDVFFLFESEGFAELC